MEVKISPTDQELIAEGDRLSHDPEAMEKCPLAMLRRIRAAQERNGVTNLAARMVNVMLKLLGD